LKFLYEEPLLRTAERLAGTFSGHLEGRVSPYWKPTVLRAVSGFWINKPIENIGVHEKPKIN
jgi:hypothetical protein